jgi:DNA repair protein RadC
MKSSNLHIKDALDSASPGTLIASRETATLHGPLRALIGKEAATLVLKHAGRPGVLHMDASALAATSGVAPELAERVVSARRLFAAARHLGPALSTSQRVLDVLPVGLADLEVEVLLAIALDARLAPMGVVLLAQGGPSSAVVVPRYVFTPLVRLGARQFILVHNHPSGCVTPSQEDIVLTNTVARLGYALDLPLVDHLIVGGHQVCSLFDLGLLPSRQELQSVELNDGLS